MPPWFGSDSRSRLTSLLNKIQSTGSASTTTSLLFLMLTTDITSVLLRLPALISASTHVSARVIHTASDLVAPPSTSVFLIDPDWSTTATVCEVQEALFPRARTAALWYRRIFSVILTRGTSKPKAGIGHDVISRLLVSSVMYTIPRKVYFQRSSPLLFS